MRSAALRLEGWRLGGWLLAGWLGACAAPDAVEDGFLLLDEGARAAGVAVEVDGERREDALPVAVPGGEGASVLHAAGHAEPIAVAPGELVEIVGAGGELRRSRAPRDGLVLSGDAAAIRRFAGLVDAEVVPVGDGRLRLSGPDLLVLASMLGPQPGIHGVRPPPEHEAPSGDLLDVGFAVRAPRVASPAQSGEVTDPAGLVGLYRHGDAAVILDAAGGYTLLQGSREVGRGRFLARPGGVEFRPSDGGPVTHMALEDERLVDGVGLRLAPVEAP